PTANIIIKSVDNGKLFSCFYPHISVDNTELIAKEIINWYKELNAGKDAACYFLDNSFENNIAKTNLCAILEQQGLTNLYSL
ncbi:site-specific DNA-methyltransferase, partial [Salmonella enterica]|nr:site-specific DNA-methyltransferase [Salmonella enterica]